jgi:predicted kinase
MSNVLAIVRGISGSGKSTYAKSLGGLYTHLEADQFFMINGKYKFDPKLLQYAHQWCLMSTINGLLSGNVVVSNTFTKVWEMEKYFEISSILDIKILVKTMKGEYNNTHGVPASVIQSMKDRWQEIPGDIIEKYKIELVD